MNDSRPSINQFEIKNDPKFIKIKDIFEKHFRSKNYYSESIFTNDVWFLKDDKQFQDLQKPSFTSNSDFENNNTMLSLLKELTLNDDLKRLAVSTNSFIDKICETLYTFQRVINRSKNLIQEYNAHENVNILSLKQKILNNRDTEESQSELVVSLSRLDMFDEGNYSFNFHFEELNPKDCTASMSKNKTLIDNKMLNIKQSGEVIILNKVDSDSQFEPIYFESIERNTSNKYINSGTTLSTFYLEITKDGIPHSISSAECFLEVFLNMVENLKNIDLDTFNTSWKIKTKAYVNNSNSLDIIVNFKFTFNNETKVKIIDRVLQILKDAIKTETKNEIYKNEILDVYFKSISDNIKQVLEKNDFTESQDCNCKNCLIY